MSGMRAMRVRVPFARLRPGAGVKSCGSACRGLRFGGCLQCGELLGVVLGPQGGDRFAVGPAAVFEDLRELDEVAIVRWWRHQQEELCRCLAAVGEGVRNVRRDEYTRA